MAAISKIRLTNIVYEDGDKRINDEVYLFDGHNGAILLENGGGKTVFIHTVLQAVLPHTNLGERKIRETLQLENGAAHIGIEWILEEKPRRYVTTAVSLFLHNNSLQSHRYVFEYEHENPNRLEKIPFVIGQDKHRRPAYKEEIAEYYQAMKSKSHNARTFDTISGFHAFIEENYQIIHHEWESIVKINGDEGGIEKFFEHCKTTTDLYDRLLIPIVEDSIEGHEKGIFADMFEKQREGFQTYVHFKKSIAEHEAIQRELAKYVQEFEQFSKLDLAYEEVKQRAKGLLEWMAEDLDETEREKATNDAEWESWHTQSETLQIKQASYHILLEQVKADELKGQFEEQFAIYEIAKERLKKMKEALITLQYAKLAREHRIAKQLLVEHEAELETHERTGEIDDIRAQWEIESAKLHGCFIRDKEAIDRELNNLKIELKPLEETMHEIDKGLEQLRNLYQVEQNKWNQLQGKMESDTVKMEKLKQQLLANPEQERVETELITWSERYQWLDEEVIRLQQEKKRKQQEIANIREEWEVQKAVQADLQVDMHDVKRDEEEIQSAHDNLIEKLVTIRKNWHTVDVHLRGDSVYSALLMLQEKLARERDDLLYKERLEHRLIDDYEDQETFFADAYLEQRVQTWQNDFFIEKGTNYVSQLPAADQDDYRAFTLWPIVLVTTTQYKETLIGRIAAEKERLQYPVLVVSMEEAKQLSMNKGELSWIEPTYWDTNMDATTFRTWKEDLRLNAKEATGFRTEKEKELRHVESIVDHFEQFMHRYPQELKDELQQRAAALHEEEAKLTRKLEQFSKETENLTEEIANIDDVLVVYQSEYHGLSEKINKANDFMDLAREVEELKRKVADTKRQLDRLKKKIVAEEKEYARYKIDEEQLRTRISDYQGELAILQANELYQSVKQFQAVFSEEEKTVIESRRKQLELEIYGIQQSYQAIITKIDFVKKDINRLETDMGSMLERHEAFDLEYKFPIDGEKQLERLQTDIEGKNLHVERLDKAQREINQAWSNQQTRVNTQKERFEIDFPGKDLSAFAMELSEVKGALVLEEQSLQERKQYLTAEKKRLEKELADLVAARQHLDKFEIAHQFNRMHITAQTVSEKERINFAYNRKQFAKEMTNGLEQTATEREKGKRKIEQAKQDFRIFCREQISERKLMEMATEGVEHQKTLVDVLNFQKNMLTTVKQADLYARNFIRDKDKEVQAFINNIHNHLLNVTGQLRVIPRNTKVKVNDNWKEIYRFSIPEWTEEEGKHRIGEYMDRILEQLDSDHFKTAQGTEDRGKVRKQIETWLDTKQLLQVVMAGQVMKVSCRKVTNDNQVTSRLTSWEQSNKWSGGEKWSKNMTLFLGILNFVAEKKQSVKRKRAVILDNPFGKASSDHVLNPVFFIAEQLGFQIIALTAHADGKFLHDYFPIIYSFRLRVAQDGTTQIMSKEKSVQHAYFRDHDPTALDRLTENEQLSLL